MKRRTLIILVQSFLMVSLLGTVHAAGLEKRVMFTKGANSAEFQGSVKHGEVDTYIVNAKKKFMNLSANITSPDYNAYYWIKAANGDFEHGTNETEKARGSAGVVVNEGDISIVVASEKGTADYTLKITLTEE